MLKNAFLRNAQKVKKFGDFFCGANNGGTRDDQSGDSGCDK